MYDTWELLDTLDARVALLWILAGKDIDASVISLVRLPCIGGWTQTPDAVRCTSSWRGAALRTRSTSSLPRRATLSRKRPRGRSVSLGYDHTVSMLLTGRGCGKRRGSICSCSSDTGRVRHDCDDRGLTDAGHWSILAVWNH